MDHGIVVRGVGELMIEPVMEELLGTPCGDARRDPDPHAIEEEPAHVLARVPEGLVIEDEHTDGKPVPCQPHRVKIVFAHGPVRASVPRARDGAEPPRIEETIGGVVVVADEGEPVFGVVRTVIPEVPADDGLVHSGHVDGRALEESILVVHHAARRGIDGRHHPTPIRRTPAHEIVILSDLVRVLVARERHAGVAGRIMMLVLPARISTRLAVVGPERDVLAGALLPLRPCDVVRLPRPVHD